MKLKFVMDLSHVKNMKIGNKQDLEAALSPYSINAKEDIENYTFDTNDKLFVTVDPYAEEICEVQRILWETSFDRLVALEYETSQDI